MRGDPRDPLNSKKWKHDFDPGPKPSRDPIGAQQIRGWIGEQRYGQWHWVRIDQQRRKQ